MTASSTVLGAFDAESALEFPACPKADMYWRLLLSAQHQLAIFLPPVRYLQPLR
jgi:hypothetical protein